MGNFSHKGTLARLLLLLLGLSALSIDSDDFRQAVCEGVLLSLLLLYVSVILILAFQRWKKALMRTEKGHY